MRNDWLRTLTTYGLSGADPEPPEVDIEPPADAATDDEGQQAIAYARRLGIRAAIESAKDKDGKPVVWQDVDTVLQLLDDSKVSIDFSTGEISGVSEQLEELANNKPFLLKVVQQQPVTPGGYGTPPVGGNSGDRPDQKQLSDYADIPAYRDALSHLI